MKNSFFTIQDICSETELEESQVRRAFKDLKEFFKNSSKRGESNKILFDSNALIIFKRVKELSLLEPSFSEALRVTEQELSNLPPQKENSITNSIEYELLSQLKEANKEASEARLAAKDSQNELERVRENLKALPSGGDAQKLNEIYRIFIELEGKTKPKFMQGKRVKELWERLQNIFVPQS